MKIRILIFAGILLYAFWASAQTTAFTYQGQLSNNGAIANGSFDMQFTLLDSGTGGAVISGPVTNAAVGVTNGFFTVQVDFGAAAFGGSPRWLQVGVRTNGATTAFTVLTPQRVTAAPYAISAITAGSASNLTGVLPASQLIGGIPAAQIDGTLSQNQLPSSVLTNNETGITLGGVFAGDGGGLTNLTAANLSGAVPASSLPVGLLTNNQASVSLSGTFSGSGSGLTGLNASQLTMGTVPLGQLPPSVLVNGANSVTLGGQFTGFFSGNGEGLNSINAGTLIGSVPPAALTSVPAANLTGTVPGPALSGIYGKAISLTNAGNTIAGDGAGLFNLPINGLPNSIVTNGETGVSLTNIILGGPITNYGGLWITNGTLFVTNSTGSVVLRAASGSITASGGITNSGALSVTNGSTTGAVIDTAGNVVASGNLTVGGTIGGGAGSVISNLVSATGTALLADIASTNALLAALISANAAALISTSNSLYASASNLAVNAITTVANNLIYAIATSSQSAAVANAAQAVTFDTTSQPAGSAFTVSGSGNTTFTPNRSGWYEVSFAVTFALDSYGDIIFAYVAKNGSEVPGSQVVADNYDGAFPGHAFGTLSQSFPVQLAASDTLQLQFVGVPDSLGTEDVVLSGLFAGGSAATLFVKQLSP